MKTYGNKIRRIMGVNPDNFSVRLRYTDGTILTVSLQSLFVRPKVLAAEILRGGIFEKCFVELGALAWPNGFELCPDALKMWGLEQQNREKKAA